MSFLTDFFKKDSEKFPYSKEEAKAKIWECLKEIEEGIQSFPIFEQNLLKEIKNEVSDVINKNNNWTGQEATLKTLLLETKIKFLMFSMDKASGWKTK